MGIIQAYPTSSNPIGRVNNDKRNLPDQTVSWNEKSKDTWQHDCMDFFTTMWMAGNPRRRNKLVNYRLVNGIFDFNSVKDSTQPFFTESDDPLDTYDTNFEHYPICTLPLKSLWGEESDRPFNYIAKAEDSESQSEFFRTKTDLLHQYVMSQVQSKIAASLQQNGIDPQSKEGQQQMQQMTPPEIEELMSRSYSTDAEKAANGILNKLYKELLLGEKFQKGWKDATIVAEEFYWIGTINGRPVVECINPLNIVYDKAYEVDYIDESEWVCRGEYMTPSQIISRYKDYLSDEDVKRISMAFRQDGMSGSGADTGMNMSELNTEWGFVSSNTMSDALYPLDPNSNFLYDNFNNGGFYGYNGTSYIGTRNHILVIHGEWRSKRKLCELTMIDQEGVPEKTILDGDFKLNKDQQAAGYTARYFWIDEVWEGTKISKDVYVKIQPKSNQYRSYYNIEKVKLGYTGGLFNNRNAPPTSPLDEMKQYQTLYNIIMNKLKEDFNSDLGQLLLMDITQVPTKHGFDLKEWLKWIKKLKIAFVDPQAEGKSSDNRFNQFSAINASLVAGMREKIDLLNYLEQRCWAQAGFNAQRLGNVSASETATGTTAALQKSYSQTADLFKTHNNIKGRVLNNLIEEAKIAYADGIEQTYFLDDMSRAAIKIDGKSFAWADLAVYVTDNTKDLKNLDYLKSLAGSALQAGASLYEVSEMGTEDSISVIREKLKNIDTYNRQMKQQEIDIKNKDLEARQKALEDQRAFDASENEKDRNKDIYVAELKALGTASINDTAAEPDILEQTKLALEQSKIEQENTFKHLEHANNLVTKNKELDLKEKESVRKANTEKYVADKSLEVAKENKNNTKNTKK